MKNKVKDLALDGVLRQNPTFKLVLGTCPTLALTTAAASCLGMGLAVTFVLICSNIIISLLRNVIPDKVRIPCYIVLIAGFVTVVEMVMHAYLPDLYEAMGVFLSLIVVNCIILGRAEMYASKNKVFDSAVDAVGMGVGFTLALFCMASIREVFGAGSWMGMEIPFIKDHTVSILVMSPGGFFVFGVLIAVVNKLTKRKKPAAAGGCAGCPGAALCRKNDVTPREEEGK